MILQQIAEVCVEDVVEEGVSGQWEKQHSHAELRSCADS